MCSVQRDRGNVIFKVPDWAMVIIVTSLLSSLTWLAVKVVEHERILARHSVEISTEHSSREDDKKIREKDLRSLLEIQREISELRAEAKRTTLSDDAKQWLRAEFSTVNVQISTIAQNQKEIKVDLKEVQNAVRKLEGLN